MAEPSNALSSQVWWLTSGPFIDFQQQVRGRSRVRRKKRRRMMRDEAVVFFFSLV